MNGVQFQTVNFGNGSYHGGVERRKLTPEELERRAQAFDDGDYETMIGPEISGKLEDKIKKSKSVSKAITLAAGATTFVLAALSFKKVMPKVRSLAGSGLEKLGQKVGLNSKNEIINNSRKLQGELSERFTGKTNMESIALAAQFVGKGADPSDIKVVGKIMDGEIEPDIMDFLNKVVADGEKSDELKDIMGYITSGSAKKIIELHAQELKFGEDDMKAIENFYNAFSRQDNSVKSFISRLGNNPSEGLESDEQLVKFFKLITEKNDDDKLILDIISEIVKGNVVPTDEFKKLVVKVFGEKNSEKVLNALDKVGIQKTADATDTVAALTLATLTGCEVGDVAEGLQADEESEINLGQATRDFAKLAAMLTGLE